MRHGPDLVQTERANPWAIIAAAAFGCGRRVGTRRIFAQARCVSER
jgi:hypothetical protein